ILDTLDVVLDVGVSMIPVNIAIIITRRASVSQHRHDHHQKGFSEVFEHGFDTKLSSVGLVYKHFGKEIIAKELGVNEDHEDVHRLYLSIYKSFVEALYAIDNGINQYDIDQPPKPPTNSTHLSSRVGRLNPNWTDPEQSPEKVNAAFEHAMILTESEFMESVRFHVKSWLPARSIILECLLSRGNIDPSREIMVLDRFCPLEEELKVDPLTKYVLYH
ncbi:hypothetical protein ACJX0J_017284, partial [Zea mays]